MLITRVRQNDEAELEREALEDVGLDEGELANVPPDVNGAVHPAVDGPASERPTSPALNPEEVEKARQIREKGLNGEGEFFSLPWTRVYAELRHVAPVDLTMIARTSAGATTSPKAPSLEVTRDADVRQTFFLIIVEMCSSLAFKRPALSLDLFF